MLSIWPKRDGRILQDPLPGRSGPRTHQRPALCGVLCLVIHARGALSISRCRRSKNTIFSYFQPLCLGITYYSPSRCFLSPLIDPLTYYSFIFKSKYVPLSSAEKIVYNTIILLMFFFWGGGAGIIFGFPKISEQMI